jgi:hypothetical protein
MIQQLFTKRANLPKTAERSPLLEAIESYTGQYEPFQLILRENLNDLESRDDVGN